MGHIGRMSFTLIFLLVQGVSAQACFGADAASLREKPYSLPWEKIVERFREGAVFCDNGGLVGGGSAKSGDPARATSKGNCDYACQPGHSIGARFPANMSASNTEQQKTKVKIAKWEKDSWNEVAEVPADIQQNELKLVGSIKDEGFFRLQFDLQMQDDKQRHVEAHAIVRENWKRDILAFCRSSKEGIESDADTQMIRSSIAVSHLDHTMEAISGESVLSGNIMKALSGAVQSKKDFAAGRCPDLVAGLNKIKLKRFEGSQVAEFVVFVPANYDPSRKWPLYLYPDPQRFYAKNNYAQKSGLIDVWWHFPFPMAFEWKDYEYFLIILKSKLNLDEDRFYLYGNCGGGIAAMAVALNHPDQWAEFATLVGNSYRHLAANAYNLPMIFVGGGQGEGHYVAYAEFAAKCFEYYRCRHFRHSTSVEAAQIRGSGVPSASRERSPQRVLYRIESLGSPKAYWVEILGREDENFAGAIDASVRGQTIFVGTTNVNAYSLELTQAPLDSNSAVEIIENGRSLGRVTGRAFTKRPDVYANAKFVKNEHLHGPVWDVFRDPYIVAWGAGGKDKHFSETSERVARSLANGAPCFADVNMPVNPIGSHNLVLVGDTESNKWLAKINEDLPVRLDKGRIIAGGRDYNAPNMGFILVYPNPMNPSRYVLVFSATSPAAMAEISRAYSGMKFAQSSDFPGFPDVGIFEVTEKGDIKWHIIEALNATWSWHSGADEVLALARKQHPKWQWHQWVAKTLRERLAADVVICEDPFRFPDSVPVGQITFRDLFKSFRNDWIIKVRVNGGSLRNLLSAPFGDVSKTKVVERVINGISLAELHGDNKNEGLEIKDVRNDGWYTVALPSGLLNSEQMGRVLTEYEIEGEGYLVLMLNDYLRESKVREIDADLDRLKVNIF